MGTLVPPHPIGRYNNRMAENKRGKIGKRIAIAIAVVAVLFFGASFAIDKISLDDTFKRAERDYPRLMPTEEFAKDYDSTPVEFQFQDATLRGYVYKAANPKGFVVFRHGITSEHADYLALICALVDRGWTVFAYDAIGCGISDGNYVKGMAQSPLDVGAAVDYVRESGLVGDLPLILWGHSWGGYGVAAALDIVSNADACITMSGYNSPVGVLMEFVGRKMGPVGITQYPTMWLNNWLTFGADGDRTALAGINKADVPVLIVHGTDDKVVEYDGSSIIAQRNRITNPNVEYLAMDEAGRNGHNSYFYATEANEYLNDIAAQFEELEKQYPNGVPEEVVERFMKDFDAERANVADPDLMNAINTFLNKAIGAEDVKTPAVDEYGPLAKASYSRSGNSLGNTYRVEAMRSDDGSIKVEVWESAQHDIPCTIHEYRAPADLLDRISAVVDKAGMKTWGELPLSEFIAYDAPTTSLSLTYDSADPNRRFPLWLSTSLTYELPKGGEDAVYGIRDLMLECATDANLIAVRTEELKQ